MTFEIHILNTNNKKLVILVFWIFRGKKLLDARSQQLSFELAHFDRFYEISVVAGQDLKELKYILMTTVTPTNENRDILYMYN